MQPAAGHAVSHIAAQLAVGGAGINIGAARPVAQGIDLRGGIVLAEIGSPGVALADDQALAAQNVFAVTAVVGIDGPGDGREPDLLICHGHALEDAVVSAADLGRLVCGEVRVLGHFDIIRHDIGPGDAFHRFFDKIRRDSHGSLRDDIADAMANQNLDCDAGILFPRVGVVDKGSGNAVGQLVGVRGIYFLKHFFHPFLARSKRSMRSSCGETSP